MTFLTYLTTFMCQFGRYRYKRLPFEAALTGNMFQWKINEIFKNLPTVFGIADDLLVVGYDSNSKDHDEMLWQLLQICRHMSLKVDKDKFISGAHQSCSLVRWFPGMEYNLTHKS